MMDTVEWLEWLDRMSEDQLVDKLREFEDKLAAAHKLVREMGVILEPVADCKCCTGSTYEGATMQHFQSFVARQLLSRPDVIKIMKEEE